MQAIKELLIKLTSFWFFYRWHPEVSLRYLQIVDEIKTLGEDINILEVGSGGLGIAPYLKKAVTGVDIEFNPPFYPLLNRIKASAAKLPFKNDSFDVVLSVDMLEHLKTEDREKAIYEMLRVAKRKVFIGVPSGKEAEAEDIILHEFYKHKFGGKYKFFEEQIKEKLPDKEIMLKMIYKSAKAHKKEIIVKIEGNENITMRRFLMKGWMTKNLLLDFFYRKILLFALPLLRIFNRAPYYRQLFFVEIKQ